MKRTAINLLAATILVFGATAAFGQTATNASLVDNNVQAHVQEKCTIGAFVLNFGIYDPVATHDVAGSDLDAATTVDVRCTKGSSGVNVTMGLGVRGDRTMANTVGGETLSYDIFTDVDRSAVWSDTSGEPVTLGGTNGMTATLNIYGRVLGGQMVGTGDYRDTVVATVNW